MRKKEISKILSTDKLAKTIFNEDGRVLLNAGVTLSPAYVERVKSMGFNSVYVDDEISKGVVFEDYLSDKTRQSCKKEIKEIIAKFMHTKKPNFDGIIECGHVILDDIMSNKGVIFDMIDIRSEDDIYIPHIINVASLVSLLAKKMGYNMMKLKDIVTGAILHDIGKVLILEEKGSTVKKIREVDPKALLEHPKRGYDLVNKSWSFSSVSKVMILMHHENCDGSGYPLEISGKDIHEAAKMVRVCDVFDNMMSGYTEDKKQVPYNKIIEYLEKMDKLFDQDVVRNLAKVVPSYPTGSSVELSTGDKGIVLKQNPTNMKKPFIRVLKNKENKMYPRHNDINLANEMKLNITGTYNGF